MVVLTDKQMKDLDHDGFLLQNLPNLRQNPKVTLYTRDRNTQKIVKMVLPGDAYSLERYKARGFVDDPAKLPLLPGEQPLTSEKCPYCDKILKSHMSLLGHISKNHPRNKRNPTNINQT
jgi:hypothetical protein